MPNLGFSELLLALFVLVAATITLQGPGLFRRWWAGGKLSVTEWIPVVAVTAIIVTTLAEIGSR